jgi:hypothetical protein
MTWSGHQARHRPAPILLEPTTTPAPAPSPARSPSAGSCPTSSGAHRGLCLNREAVRTIAPPPGYPGRAIPFCEMHDWRRSSTPVTVGLVDLHARPAGRGCRFAAAQALPPQLEQRSLDVAPPSAEERWQHVRACWNGWAGGSGSTSASQAGARHWSTCWPA